MNTSTSKYAPRIMEEQETIITFDRVDNTMRIYTADSTMITLLDKKYPRAKEYTDKGACMLLSMSRIRIYCHSELSGVKSP